MRRLLIPVAALVAAFPAAASAAEPATGTLSAASPKVSWAGTVQGGILFHNTYFYEGTTLAAGGTLPCEAPGCDTFTLENADGTADLNLELASEQSPDISLRIQDPSGTWTYYNGWNDAAPVTKVRLKKAPKGTYVINVVIRRLGTTNPTAVDDTSDYTGTASLALAPTVATPPVPAVNPPAPAPAPADPAPARKPSAKAACQKKAKKIKNKRKRKAALKRCAKKR